MNIIAIAMRIALNWEIAAKIDRLITKYPEIENELRKLSDKDPTPQKKYLEWGAKQISNGAESSDVQDAMIGFHNNINFLNKKDINSWEVDDILQKITELENKKSKTREKTEIKTKGGKKLHEDDECLVIEVIDQAAACYYGKGTKWCITMEAGGAWDEYADENAKFIFILRKGLDINDPMYKIAVAITIDSVDYYDARDNHISRDEALDGLSAKNNIIGIINNVELETLGLDGFQTYLLKSPPKDLNDLKNNNLHFDGDQWIPIRDIVRHLEGGGSAFIAHMGMFFVVTNQNDQYQWYTWPDDDKSGEENSAVRALNAIAQQSPFS